jgi:hypothetical protein
MKEAYREGPYFEQTSVNFGNGVRGELCRSSTAYPLKVHA